MYHVTVGVVCVPSSSVSTTDGATAVATTSENVSSASISPYVPSSSGVPSFSVLATSKETDGAVYVLTVIGSSVFVVVCPLESVTVTVGVNSPP